jgi:hypothetical protein
MYPVAVDAKMENALPLVEVSDRDTAVRLALPEPDRDAA